jgi:DNA-binding transcriptional ArsR family regulator
MKPRSPTSSLALDALGNEVRRGIVRILAKKPSSVGELSEYFPVSRPAISRHLRLLEGAGLVAHEAVGNRNLYRLDARGFEAVRSWLDRFWDDALARFKLVAENTCPRRRRG